MSARFSRSVRRFLRDERGGTAVEFGLLCALFLGMMLGSIDMARLAWEINSAKAATKAGARYAVVSLPVTDWFDSFDAVAAAGGNGLAVPDQPPITCNNTSCSCSGSGCKAGTLQKTRFTTLVGRMTPYYGRLTAANVVVEYRHVAELGVAGIPCAPNVEPLVTVRLQNLTFDSGVLRLFGVQPFNLPPVATTLSGESLGKITCG
jgi:hypothetical protein